MHRLPIRSPGRLKPYPFAVYTYLAARTFRGDSGLGATIDSRQMIADGPTLLIAPPAVRELGGGALTAKTSDARTRSIER
jgi:hypothetical protein